MAFAALMAAAALVAVPDPAGSRSPSPARTPEPAAFIAATVAVSARDAATTSSADVASGPADPGPAAAWVEAGALPPLRSRPQVRQPAPHLSVLHKNPWRFDPDISWYGPGFYGSGTACGQEYTRELMGVAHRTLPCGTVVTFRNPANGRTVTVRVIDRGPYVAGRTWDMSRGMCEYLDHCYTGSIEWRLGGRAGS
jgi:hypothetical protein